MKAGDELARTIQFAKELADPDWSLSVPHTAKQAITRLVEIIETKHRTITTREELESLGAGAVILDTFGDVSQRRGGEWCSYETHPATDRQVSKYLPATVLWEPSGE